MIWTPLPPQKPIRIEKDRVGQSTFPKLEIVTFFFGQKWWSTWNIYCFYYEVLLLQNVRSSCQLCFDREDFETHQDIQKGPGDILLWTTLSMLEIVGMLLLSFQSCDNCYHIFSQTSITTIVPHLQLNDSVICLKHLFYPISWSMILSKR